MKIILFDGVCNLCSRSVEIIIRHDKYNCLHFASIQSASGIALIAKHQIDPKADSVIFIDDNEVFYKTEALLQITLSLKGWPLLLRLIKIFPKFTRDFYYDLIAKNRYKLFGKRSECKVPKSVDAWRFL
jgi:predicted DCC family thiol-disulfide oxidoreductase YuxK